MVAIISSTCVQGVSPSAGFGVEVSAREAEHQPARSPVRQVEERVEVAFHQLLGAAAEIAVVVLIDEPGGGDLRAARQLPQFSALLVGERTVEREELVVLILPDRIAGECECPADGLCADAVAAVLAWVRAGTDPDEPDLFEVLRTQDPDWLATRLAEPTAADPALAGRLLAEAEDGEAPEEVAELDEVLDELEDEASSLGLYDEWYPDGEALDELLDEVAEFVPAAPDAVRELADHVITRTERLLNYENCCGEGITEALEKAQDLHLAACGAGSPDPDALAERLATGALESGWRVFRDGPAKYARMLGAAGLARYRELPTWRTCGTWPDCSRRCTAGDHDAACALRRRQDHRRRILRRTAISEEAAATD